MYIIRNPKVIDFLWINNVYPAEVYNNVAYYVPDDKLRDLLERYYIQTECFRNKGW